MTISVSRIRKKIYHIKININIVEKLKNYEYINCLSDNIEMNTVRIPNCIIIFFLNNEQMYFK